MQKLFNNTNHMSNSNPSSIHIFVFKLGMQLSQDAVFTSFWRNNSFTFTFITSPAFIDKCRVLSYSNLLQEGVNPFGGDLSCSCNVCCFGDYGCPLILGFLHCDVSALGLSYSLPSSLSLQEIGNPQGKLKDLSTCSQLFSSPQELSLFEDIGYQ